MSAVVPWRSRARYTPASHLSTDLVRAPLGWLVVNRVRRVPLIRYLLIEQTIIRGHPHGSAFLIFDLLRAPLAIPRPFARRAGRHRFPRLRRAALCRRLL